jgi:ribosomal protein L27
MAKNWIAGATKNGKGALHRNLGIPEGQKIPAGKIVAAAKGTGKVAKEARLAQTLKGLRKK